MIVWNKVEGASNHVRITLFTLRLNTNNSFNLHKLYREISLKCRRKQVNIRYQCVCVGVCVYRGVCVGVYVYRGVCV